MTYSRTVKKYARKLYFTLDEYSERKYTYPEIAQLTKTHFRDAPIDVTGQKMNTLSDITVMSWATAEHDVTGYSWQDIYEKTYGMQKRRAADEIANVLENQELADHIKDLPNLRRKVAITMYLKGLDYMFSHGIDSTAEAQWMIVNAQKEFKELGDNEEQSKDDEQAKIFALLGKTARLRGGSVDANKRG